MTAITPIVRAIEQTGAPGVSGKTHSGKSFAATAKAIESGGSVKESGDIHRELVELRDRIASGEHMPPRELLHYQIRVGQLHLRVELVSKLGESLGQTVRRLEQG